MTAAVSERVAGYRLPSALRNAGEELVTRNADIPALPDADLTAEAFAVQRLIGGLRCDSMRGVRHYVHTADAAGFIDGTTWALRRLEAIREETARRRKR